MLAPFTAVSPFTEGACGVAPSRRATSEYSNSDAPLPNVELVDTAAVCVERCGTMETCDNFGSGRQSHYRWTMKEKTNAARS
jgi:hypothetical protein